jgi:hypothetical protein
MAGGRPKKYETEDAMLERVDAYFVHIKGEVRKDQEGKQTNEWKRYPEPATITGLALFLGFESRQSIYDYELDGEFSYIIKNARLRVECEYEKRLTTAQSATGAIFALKNMGWKDKSELEHTTPVPVIWHEEKTYKTKEGE